MATPIPRNDVELSAEQVARETGGVVVGDASARARGIWTDSRAVARGSAFVAISGETFDGAAFATAAFDAGATLVVAERSSRAIAEVRRAASASPGRALVEVDGAVVALGALGRAHLSRWRRASGRRVVAITGSSGKTTTKELTRAALGASGAARATVGNLNNLIGLPMTIFTVTDEVRFAVLEMGMSFRGEIAALAGIGEPDVGIVTNIGDAHAENVGGREGVAREKGALFEALGPDAVAIVNVDDPLAVRESSRAKGRRVSFGRAEHADYRLVAREPIAGAASSRVRIARPAGVIDVVLPLPGEVAALDLLSAIAAAEAASGVVLPAGDLEAALAAVELSGRATTLSGVRGELVIDDTYNANPSSMAAALQTLAEVGQGRRLVAVLGEMKELGDISKEAHRELGVRVAEAGVSLLVTCGGLAELTRAEAELRGVETLGASDAASAAELARGACRAGDAVLVKASRSVGAEAVVRCLTGPERSIVLPSHEKGASSGGAGPGGGTGQAGRS
ncbi:MAG: UDP-N-acetylmuramoyl-tripeptide--D-alanyl-D-alanine ligase [Myxococcales bacterium]|nr:UDP-N-acetylmuramoyl-tripeptide--D-alanyl-D-alanine ligase [Myxococcales bacterium]